MILVIADDLSGAAELAGIAAAHGCSAEVHTDFDPTSRVDVVAVDSQTRSLAPEMSAAKVEKIIRKAIDPDWVYKKTDSVLRGNIRAELESLMKAIGKQRALFIPANPGKGRRIRKGDYYVNHVPLHETVFASDPDHPQSTSNVIEALGKGALVIRSIRRNESLPEKGIIVPDVESGTDILKRASEVDDGTFTAGAAEFFAALLNSRTNTERRPGHTALPGGASLFVCGSLAAWDQKIAHTARARGVPVFTMSAEEPSSGKVQRAIEMEGAALLAIGKPDGVERLSPSGLLAGLIDSSVAILDQINVDQIFLEGGATASAFIQRMGWTRFKVLPVNLTGVGCLRPTASSTAPTLLVKPGSYPWPDEVWQSIGTTE